MFDRIYFPEKQEFEAIMLLKILSLKPYALK
jgi:hypothetical protein